VATVVALGVMPGCADDSDTAAGQATPAAATPARSTEPLPTPVQELEIDATEYTFDMQPAPTAGLRPGWTKVTFRNVGDEPHQVMFARLKDGVDMAALAEAGAGDSSGAAAIEFVDMIGGVSYIGPDNEITAMVDLPSGTVMAMCYVPTHEGVAHALLGMSTVLDVAEPTEATAPAGGQAPDDAAATSAPVPGPAEVRGTIEMSPEGYVIPSPLEAGWYHVVNTEEPDGAEGLHELSLLRLDRPLEPGEADQVVADLAANRTPDVGIDAMGGLGAISAGFEGYLWLDLPEGEYMAVDFMPDPGDPRPHMLDGYHATFRP
jgi:hypothetical protein